MFLSIVIPVYDVAPYLPDCLDSLLRQTGDVAYEIIAVDDGSTDGSSGILEAYARLHPDRLRTVLLDRNRGVSSARNRGLELARGEYVWFVDGDDLVPSHSVDTLWRIAVLQPEVDVIGFRFRKFRDGQPCPVLSSPGIRTLFDYAPLVETADFQAVFRLLNGAESYLTAANALFRRIHLGRRCFNAELSHAEDQLFVFSVILDARSVVFTDAVFYCYRQRPDSAVYGRTTEQALSVSRAYVLMAESLSESPRLMLVAPIQRKRIANTMAWVFSGDVRFESEEREQLRRLWKRLFSGTGIFSFPERFFFRLFGRMEPRVFWRLLVWICRFTCSR